MRYAIYFIPAADTPLWQFGCSAIGYDAVRGDAVALPGHPAYAHPDARSWLSEPARYGFHATLKAPFTLAEGCEEDDLRDAAAVFAAEQKAFTLPDLMVKSIGRFLALVPADPPPELNVLAGDCVRAFERLRAPLSDADIRRRLESPLTARQIGYLNRWGYPYVFEDFRFHMTLSGAVDDAVPERLEEALKALYAPIAAPMLVDAITICRQDTRSTPFRVLERLRFGG